MGWRELTLGYEVDVFGLGGTLDGVSEMDVEALAVVELR